MDFDLECLEGKKWTCAECDQDFSYTTSVCGDTFCTKVDGIEPYLDMISQAWCRSCYLKLTGKDVGHKQVCDKTLLAEQGQDTSITAYIKRFTGFDLNDIENDDFLQDVAYDDDITPSHQDIIAVLDSLPQELRTLAVNGESDVLGDIVSRLTKATKLAKVAQKDIDISADSSTSEAVPTEERPAAES